MTDYRRFHNKEEVADWVKKHYTEENLRYFTIKSGDDTTFSWYKGNGYKSINRYLAMGVENIQKDYDIQELQDKLLACSIPENIVTSRFVSLKEVLTLLKTTIFHRTYVDPIFLSTTLLKDDYRMDGIKAGRFCITIEVDKGVHGTYLPEFNPELPEYEILFAHHSKLIRTGFLRYRIIG